MNRRQFLTGASAIAVASALPAAPALTVWEDIISGNRVNAYADPGTVLLQQIYWRGRWFWITGNDNIIHVSEPCDPHTFVPKHLPEQCDEND